MSGKSAPPKPWERSRSSAPIVGSSDSLPKPWEQPTTSGPVTVTPVSQGPNLGNAVSGGQSARPWDTVNNNHFSTSTYGPGGSTTPYGGYNNSYSLYSRPAYSSYGSGYGSGYGGYGGGMYGGGYGGGMYGGGGYGGAGGYGYGMHGRPGGMYGPGMGPIDPNNPSGFAPPSAWQAMLAGISNIVHFFGRLSFLVDENAHAVHFFISALLQLLDRFGSLYGELARFILRILGFKPKEKQSGGPPGPAGQQYDRIWSDHKTQ